MGTQSLLLLKNSAWNATTSLCRWPCKRRQIPHLSTKLLMALSIVVCLSWSHAEVSAVRGFCSVFGRGPCVVTSGLDFVENGKKLIAGGRTISVASQNQLTFFLLPTERVSAGVLARYLSGKNVLGSRNLPRGGKRNDREVLLL